MVKAGGEQHSNDFREVNPMEQVPALQIDGHTLIESVSIELYRILYYPDFEITYDLFSVKYNALFGGNATTKTITTSRCT